MQSYSQNDIRLKQVAHIHLTIGSFSLKHPVYISQMDTYPFLIGKDLLERFEPLLDFKHLTVWAQVQEPLPPLQSHRLPKPDWPVIEGTRTTTKPDSKVTEFIELQQPSMGTQPQHQVKFQVRYPALDHAMPTQRCVT